MEKVLRRMGIDVTVHGFRSAFRDWAGNETHFPRELPEHALAHAIGNAAEQAYRRSDALEKRRALMDAWATYCEPSSADEKVTLLRRKA
jgi:integrase